MCFQQERQMTRSVPANRNSFDRVMYRRSSSIEPLFDNASKIRQLFLENSGPPYFPFKSASPIRPIAPSIGITETKNRFHAVGTSPQRRGAHEISFRHKRFSLWPWRSCCVGRLVGAVAI